MTSSETSTHVVIQSRLRDVNVYPNPWSYKVFTTERIRNVIKVDLISAIIPVTIETVNSVNNVIQYVDAVGQQQEVVIPTGTYDLSLLLDTLSQSVTGATFGVNANGFITISVDSGEFTFLFGSGAQAAISIHELLGFENADLGPGTSFTAPFKVSAPPANFITVSVKELPRALCQRVLRNLGAVSTAYSGRANVTDEYVLGRIPLDVAPNSNKFYTASDVELLHNRTAPFDLNGFSVTLNDDLGRPYACTDDHSFTLAITTCAPSQLAAAPCCRATGPISLF